MEVLSKGEAPPNLYKLISGSVPKDPDLLPGRLISCRRDVLCLAALSHVRR